MCHSSARVADRTDLILTRISAGGFCGGDCNGEIVFGRNTEAPGWLEAKLPGLLSLRSVVAYDIVALVLSGPPWRASRLRLRRLVSACIYSAARVKQIIKEATTQL
jgi:hypothetical protein